jgi:hypothetical protein
LTAGAHIRAELVLGLRLEHRVLELDRDGAADPFAHVLAGEILAGELVDPLEQAFAEGREVGAAIVGELAVDEAEVGLAVGAGVGERELELVLAMVEDLVMGLLLADLGAQQVLEPLLGEVGGAVVDDAQAGIEVAVVAQALGDELIVPVEVLEDLGVGGELDIGAIGLALVAPILLLDQLAALEQRALEGAVAEADHLEAVGQRVDRLGADAVQPDRELEDVIVVLAAGVDLADAFDDLSERDAAAVVADGDGLLLALDLDLAPLAHDEFIDRVVDDLLEQHVDAVGGVAAVADAPDVHAGAQADMGERIQALDRLLIVLDLLLRHGSTLSWNVQHTVGSPFGPSRGCRSAGRRRCPWLAGDALAPWRGRLEWAQRCPSRLICIPIPSAASTPKATLANTRK